MNTEEHTSCDEEPNQGASQDVSPPPVGEEEDEEWDDTDPEHDKLVAACKSMFAAGVYYPPDPNQQAVVIPQRYNLQTNTNHRESP